MITETLYRTIPVEDDIVMAQDSYYTRNPEDSAVDGDIGPLCPSRVFVKEIKVYKHHDASDGDTWFTAKVKHDSFWEIYTDTGFQESIDNILRGPAELEKFMENREAIFSEQGLQEDRLADFDIVGTLYSNTEGRFKGTQTA